MGAGCVLCDDVLRRRMRTCVLSVSSTVGWSVDPGTTSRHFGGETKIEIQAQVFNQAYILCHFGSRVYSLSAASSTLVKTETPTSAKTESSEAA